MPKYRVTINGNTYTVAIQNVNERPVRALVNGKIIEVHVDDAPFVESDAQAMVPAMPGHFSGSEAQMKSSLASQASPAGDADNDIKAPLPGIIVSISVKEGDRVASGQELCVLEAMKMNNPIRSPLSGTVKTIHITVGQQVQHGVPLMTIED